MDAPKKKATAVAVASVPCPRSRLGCAALFNVFRPFTVPAMRRAAVLARLSRGRILRVVDVLSALRRIFLVWVGLVPWVLLVPFSVVSHDCSSWKVKSQHAISCNVESLGAEMRRRVAWLAFFP